jgi:predicted porin
MNTLQQGAAIFALACAFPCGVQSSVQLHGVADTYVGRLQLAGQSSRLAVESGGLSLSRWGLRASEDLGGGLKLNADLTSFFRIDAGEAGRNNAEGLFGERATVGLSGALGAVDAGRMITPIALAVLETSPMEAPLFNPVLMHTQTGGQPLTSVLAPQDNRANNSLNYTSPMASGLRLRAQYGFGEAAGAPGRYRVSLAIGYDRGRLSARAGMARDRTALPPGESKQTTAFAGASYELGSVRLFGQAMTSSYATLARDTAVLAAGLSVPAGSARLVAACAGTRQNNAAGSDPQRTTTTLAYLQPLSRRTDIYAFAMHDHLTSANDGNSVAAGLRHRF